MSLILWWIRGDEEYQQIECTADDRTPPLLNTVSLGIHESLRNRERYIQFLMCDESAIDTMRKVGNETVGDPQDPNEARTPTPLPSLNSPLPPIEEDEFENDEDFESS